VLVLHNIATRSKMCFMIQKCTRLKYGKSEQEGLRRFRAQQLVAANLAAKIAPGSHFALKKVVIDPQLGVNGNR
jgi:hypothetical protein